ncbi:hypothetical protein SCHPADRAFT_976496 [Schizopora paradoxa]|uniref:Uncharacterized protein n=1 Tax=Schizopora paradoxa TaxID=27342 RepID=A0A0H2RN18_9AGAM|nr:hypothetical protein SCHPADRAFT_976496 [Schizopora paradoxa]
MTGFSRCLLGSFFVKFFLPAAAILDSLESFRKHTRSISGAEISLKLSTHGQREFKLASCARNGIMCVTIMAAVTASTSSLTVSEDEQRLPFSVKPVHYDLTIRTDLEKLEFDGWVSITLNVQKETSRLVFHSSDLTFSDIVLHKESPDIKETPVTQTRDTVTERAIELPSDLQCGSTVILQAKFQGLLTADIMGHYRSSLKNEGKEVYYSLTVSLITFIAANLNPLKPTAARRGFPCWGCWRPFIGEEVLQGVTIYLKDHLFGSSVSNDLWEGVIKAAKRDATPFGYHASGKHIVDRSIVLSEREMVIPLDTSKPFNLNSDTTSVYRRSQLAQEAVKKDSFLTLNDRLGLVHDVFALANAGYTEISTALNLVDNLRKKEEDSRDIRVTQSLLIGLAVKYGGKKEYEAVKAMFEKPELRPLVKQRYQDYYIFFAYLSNNRKTSRRVASFFKEHYDEFRERFSKNMRLNYLVSYTFKRLASDADVEDVEEFFKFDTIFSDEDVPKFNLVLRQTLDNIRFNAELIKRSTGDIVQYLGNWTKTVNA